MRTLAELIAEAGHTPRSYSGRGMYGDRCLAVDCDDDALRLFADIIRRVRFNGGDDGNDELDMVLDAMRCTQVDSMGRGIVAYWTAIEAPPEADDFDDEEDES